MPLISTTILMPFTHRRLTAVRTLRHAWLSVVLLLFTAAPGAAQVLQGAHVLDLMVRALAGADTLRVEQMVVIDDRDIADDPLTLSETLFYAFPGRFRSEAAYQDSHRIHVVDHDRRLTLVDGRPAADPAGPYDRYKDLLLYRTRKDLHRMLLASGVDVELTSLGRLDEQIVHVLGARYPDESASQVWVDRESFLPLRWLHISGEGPEDRVAFIYRQWQKQGEQWYPGQVATYHQKRLIRRIDVRKIEADIALPGDWFDTERLLHSQPPPEMEAEKSPRFYETAPEQDLVRQLIEKNLENELAE
ncbi:MAG: hypothetical protein KFF50_02775 [Desulfatitalea sp.]|nr:hypothetical protein [Desulfatitalea sp.]